MQNQNPQFRAAEAQNETKPVYLYIFRLTPYFGPPASYYLCSYDQPVTLNGLPADKGANPQVFANVSIAHTEIGQSAEANNPTSAITFALNQSEASNEVRKYFLSAIPTRIDVTIIRANAAALPNAIEWGIDTYVVFRGVKMAITLDGPSVTVSCVNLMIQEDGKIPRFYYQKTCQHDLGGEFCKVDLELPQHRITSTVDFFNRAEKTIGVFTSNFDNAVQVVPEQLIGGKFILLNAGNPVNVISISAAKFVPELQIRLAWWDDTIAEGSTFKIHRGCLRIVRSCAEFANVKRFGGTPKIPISNPSVDGINT
jgi:hypothetical protein